MSKEPKRNVYVGHRYVPKIMDEWDKTISYEGLSIVTYQGTSYTSKKRVPVGIDILNEEYWAVTGNYNAQVETYRKEVKDMGEKVNNKMDETIAHVDESLTQVNNQLGENTNEIEHVKHRFTNVKNSDGAITHMLNVGLTYAQNTEFVYGNSNVLNSSDPTRRGVRNQSGKWEIDCSAFINALLQDIPFNKSAYVNQGYNYPSNRGYKFTEDDSYSGGRLLAHDLAKYAYDRGWTFEPNEDYSNIEVGDMLLFANNPVEHFWRGIGHIGVVTDIQLNKEKAGVVSFETLESSGTNYAVDYVRRNSSTLPYANMILVARFPLPDVSTVKKVIADEPLLQLDTGVWSKSLVSNERLEELKMYTIEFDFTSEDPENYPQLRHYVNGTLETVYSFTSYQANYTDGYHFKLHFWFNRGSKTSSNNILLYHLKSGSSAATFKNVKLYEGVISSFDTPSITTGRKTNNSNGESIYLPDGTLICKNRISFTDGTEIEEGNLFKSEIKKWTFPASFIDIPFVTIEPGISFKWGSVTSTVSPDDVNYIIFSTRQDDQPFNVNMLAVGRWK